MSLDAKTIEYRKALGFCVYCPRDRENVPPKGKKCCTACVQERLKSRNNRLAAGLCETCGKKPRAVVNDKTLTTCKGCLEDRRDKQTKMRPVIKAAEEAERARRIAAKLCTQCPKRNVKPAREGFHTCAGCAAEGAAYSANRREHRERLIAQGVCIDCEEAPAKGGCQTCEDCTFIRQVKDDARQEQRLASGKCGFCGKRPRRTIRQEGLPDRLGKACEDCVAHRKTIPSNQKRTKARVA